MPNYVAGYAKALNDENQSASRNAYIQQVAQQLQHQQWLMDQERIQREQQQRTFRNLGMMMPQMGGGMMQPPEGGGAPPLMPGGPGPSAGPPPQPFGGAGAGGNASDLMQAMLASGTGGMPPQQPPLQPPMPGQPSVPMMQPGANAAAMLQGPPPTGLASGMMGAGPTTPPLPGAGQDAAPPPQGWQPSKAASPELGGAPPALPGGPTTPPAGVNFTAPPKLPPAMLSIPNVISQITKMNLPPEESSRLLFAMKPLIESQQQDLIKQYQIENAAQAASIKAYAAAKTAGAKEAMVMPAQTRADAAMVAANAKGGGATPGGPLEPEDYNADPLLENTRRTQAWNYINKGVLPYRKATGGGKDLNEHVMRMVSQIAQENNMTPEEIIAQPAEWKANAASLNQQQKKVDAIGGQLESFHNNLDTWNSLAQGIAPTIGGERVKDFAKQVEKINFTGVRTIDDVKLKVQQEFNDPTVSAMMVAAMAAAMDYARIMQGPQSIASLSEGARHDAQRLVSVAADDKARQGIMAALESDTQGQVQGMETQLRKTRDRMGMPGGRSAGERREQAGAPAAPKAQTVNGAVSGAASAGGTAPQDAIDYLKGHPELKDQFKAKYGYLPPGM